MYYICIELHGLSMYEIILLSSIKLLKLILTNWKSYKTSWIIDNDDGGGRQKDVESNIVF